MSSSNSAGSVKPIAPAMRAEHSLLLTASPSGSIAASFQPIQRWPHAGDDVVGLDAGSWPAARCRRSLAVSVRNCSWTTVNRSSRAMPRRAFSAFGTITSGLQFHTIIARTGGCSSSRISPSRLMLSVRGARPASRSGRLSATSSTSWSCHEPTLRISPPPRSLPRAGQRRQAGERAEEHRPVLVVLGADQRADRGGADGPVRRGQPLDHVGVDTALGGGALGRPVGDVRGELVEAERVLVDPLGVGQTRRR